jgi:hypothetical protein
MQDDHSTSDCTSQMAPSLTRTSTTARLRFSLRSLVIAIFVMCGLLAALVPSVRHLRGSAQKSFRQFTMQAIGLALLNYYDVYKTFPCAITYAEDGTPMHSWRCLTWPFFESAVVFRYDFNEPWNGPNNNWMRTAKQCPSDYHSPIAAASQNPLCTNYVMLIDDRPGSPNGPPNRPGSAPPSVDDKSAVIVLEIADSDIHWMEPRDVLLSELSMKINDRSKRSLSSYHGGACIAHADGSVEILDEATTEERLRELLAQ